MKKICSVAILILCLSLCSCGTSADANTPKSAELSEKYDFYKESVKSIRNGCHVTPEEADEIFLILVDKCGMTDLINNVYEQYDGSFSISTSEKNYTVTLENSVVSTVTTPHWFSNVQLYPEDESNLEYAEEDSAADGNENPVDSAGDNSETSIDSAVEVPHRSGEEIVGISDKNISEIDIYFWGEVRNDVTGNWRYSSTADDIDIENYALSYYKEYFENDNEIHCIVNFTRKTTASLKVYGGMIFLSLYDYVDGEEHDANLMFSGTPLIDYIIYTDNGDIEKVETTD